MSQTITSAEDFRPSQGSQKTLQEELLKCFIQAVEAEYGLEQGNTPLMRRLSRIQPLTNKLKEFKNKAIPKSQQKVFIEYLLKYVEICLGFVSNYEEMGYRRQQQYANVLLSFIPDLFQAPDIKNMFVKEATTKIFDLLMYGAFTTVSKKSLLSMFNSIADQTKKEVRIETAKSIIYYMYKLIDCLSTYGDFVIQSDIMETLYRIFGHQIRNNELRYDLLPGSKELSESLVKEISLNDFDADVRRWLNKFNNDSQLIFSIACKALMFDNTLCKCPDEGPDGLWLDFDLQGNIVSFFSVDATESNWNRIIIMAKDVKKVEVKRQFRSNENTTIFLNLSKPCISDMHHHQEYWDSLGKNLKIIISNVEKEKITRLISQVLPRVFGDRFLHTSARISEKIKQVYKPLAIKLSKRKSSASEVSSAASKSRSDQAHSPDQPKQSVVSILSSSVSKSKTNESSIPEIKHSRVKPCASDISWGVTDFTHYSSRPSDITSGRVSVITSNNSEIFVSRPSSTDMLEDARSLQKVYAKVQDNIVTSSHGVDDDSQTSSGIELLSGQCSDHRPVSLSSNHIEFRSSELFSSSPFKRSRHIINELSDDEFHSAHFENSEQAKAADTGVQRSEPVATVPAFMSENDFETALENLEELTWSDPNVVRNATQSRASKASSSILFNYVNRVDFYEEEAVEIEVTQVNKKISKAVDNVNGEQIVKNDSTLDKFAGKKNTCTTSGKSLKLPKESIICVDSDSDDEPLSKRRQNTSKYFRSRDTKKNTEALTQDLFETPTELNTKEEPKAVQHTENKSMKLSQYINRVDFYEEEEPVEIDTANVVIKKMSKICNDVMEELESKEIPKKPSTIIIETPIKKIAGKKAHYSEKQLRNEPGKIVSYDDSDSDNEPLSRLLQKKSNKMIVPETSESCSDKNNNNTETLSQDLFEVPTQQNITASKPEENHINSEIINSEDIFIRPTQPNEVLEPKDQPLEENFTELSLAVNVGISESQQSDDVVVQSKRDSNTDIKDLNEENSAKFIKQKDKENIIDSTDQEIITPLIEQMEQPCSGQANVCLKVVIKNQPFLNTPELLHILDQDCSQPKLPKDAMDSKKQDSVTEDDNQVKPTPAKQKRPRRLMKTGKKQFYLRDSNTELVPKPVKGVKISDTVDNIVKEIPANECAEETRELVSVVSEERRNEDGCSAKNGEIDFNVQSSIGYDAQNFEETRLTQLGATEEDQMLNETDPPLSITESPSVIKSTIKQPVIKLQRMNVLHHSESSQSETEWTPEINSENVDYLESFDKLQKVEEDNRLLLISEASKSVQENASESKPSEEELGLENANVINTCDPSEKRVEENVLSQGNELPDGFIQEETDKRIANEVEIIIDKENLDLSNTSEKSKESDNVEVLSPVSELSEPNKTHKRILTDAKINVNEKKHLMNADQTRENDVSGSVQNEPCNQLIGESTPGLITVPIAVGKETNALNKRRLRRKKQDEEIKPAEQESAPIMATRSARLKKREAIRQQSDDTDDDALDNAPIESGAEQIAKLEPANKRAKKTTTGSRVTGKSKKRQLKSAAKAADSKNKVPLTSNNAHQSPLAVNCNNEENEVAPSTILSSPEIAAPRQLLFSAEIHRSFENDKESATILEEKQDSSPEIVPERLFVTAQVHRSNEDYAESTSQNVDKPPERDIIAKEPDLGLVEELITSPILNVIETKEPSSQLSNDFDLFLADNKPVKAQPNKTRKLYKPGSFTYLDEIRVTEQSTPEMNNTPISIGKRTKVTKPRKPRTKQLKDTKQSNKENDSSKKEVKKRNPRKKKEFSIDTTVLKTSLDELFDQSLRGVQFGTYGYDHKFGGLDNSRMNQPVDIVVRSAAHHASSIESPSQMSSPPLPRTIQTSRTPPNSSEFSWPELDRVPLNANRTQRSPKIKILQNILIRPKRPLQEAVSNQAFKKAKRAVEDVEENIPLPVILEDDQLGNGGNDDQNNLPEGTGENSNFALGMKLIKFVITLTEAKTDVDSRRKLRSILNFIEQFQ